jgi:plastocyanin
MKQLFTLLAFAPIVAWSQTTWEVEAGGSTAPGSTTDPYYSPMTLEIMVGDAVHWEGVSGSHNVYGGLDDFPDNPEGFTSGEPEQDLDYTRTFTIPGVYMYHCTQQGHSQTQHGMITVVEDDTQVSELTEIGSLSLFPMPATGQLNIKLEGGELRTAEIFSVDGRLRLSVPLLASERNLIDVSALTHGRYLLRLLDSNGLSLVRPFVKD